MKDIPVKTLHKINCSFDWVLPEQLTIAQAKDIGMVKFVAMVEGKLKSGEVMTRDNVIAGAGGMRAAAALGHARLNIDHIDTALPEKYVEKYGKELAEGYPDEFGYIMDAQAVEENGKMRVEGIGFVSNRKAYELLGEGKFVGCSVEDATRELKCEDECEYKGSAYINNALILDEVPNSQETWVSQVTESDLGTIIVQPETQKHRNNPIRKIIMRKLQHHTMDDYIEDGLWKDGKDSAVKFLTDIKKLPEDRIEEIASFIFDNPTLLNQYQLEHLSAGDILAWYSSLQMDAMREDLARFRHYISVINWLPHNRQQLAEYNAVRPKDNAVRYGQGEAGYMNPAEDQSKICKGCRFFMQADPEDPDGTGECIIVTDEVAGLGGCKKFDPNPTAPAEPEPEPEGNPEDPMGSDTPPENPEEPMATPKQKEKIPLKKNALIESKPSIASAESNHLLDTQIGILKKQKAQIGIPFGKRQGAAAIARRAKIQKEIDRLLKLKKNTTRKA